MGNHSEFLGRVISSRTAHNLTENLKAHRLSGLDKALTLTVLQGSHSCCSNDSRVRLRVISNQPKLTDLGDFGPWHNLETADAANSLTHHLYALALTYR